MQHDYGVKLLYVCANNLSKVGLAESTCAGRKFPPTNATRTGFIDIVQLGQLALEVT